MSRKSLLTQLPIRRETRPGIVLGTVPYQLPSAFSPLLLHPGKLLKQIPIRLDQLIFNIITLPYRQSLLPQPQSFIFSDNNSILFQYLLHHILHNIPIEHLEIFLNIPWFGVLIRRDLFEQVPYIVRTLLMESLRVEYFQIPTDTVSFVDRKPGWFS